MPLLRIAGRSVRPAALLALWLAATAAAAQYAAPGPLTSAKIWDREAFDSKLEEARWRAGKIRLVPRLWLGDLAYVDNVYATADERDQVSDLSGSIGLGLEGYLPVGSKLGIAAYALPEYNWWREQTDLRAETGRYGVRFFGFFNRLTLLLDARSLESQRPLNRELEVPVEEREQRGRISFELDVSAPVAIFGSASEGEIRLSGDGAEQNVPGLTLSTLERDEQTASLGVRLRRKGNWAIGVGYEQTDTEFLDDPGGRSNSTSGPLAELRLTGSRLNLDLRAVWTSTEFEPPSGLEDFDSVNGSGTLTWDLGVSTALAFYGTQGLGYSAEDVGNVFVETRFGVSGTRVLGRRVDLELFVETGEQEYEEAGSFADRRIDDYSGYGGTLGVRLSERFALTIRYTETSFDSSIPGFDRTRRSIGANLALGDDQLPW